VVGVYELVIAGRHFRQHTEPSERVGTFEDGQRVARDGTAANTVKTIAADNVVAIQAMSAVRRIPGDPGGVGLQSAWLRIHRPIDDFDISLVGSLVEILHDLGLTVDGDGRAIGELGEIDMKRVAIDRQRSAGMHQAFAGDPCADAQPVHEINGRLLENPGANACGYIVSTAEFEHDGVYARLAQQMSQEHSGGTCPDDCNLRAQRPLQLAKNAGVSPAAARYPAGSESK